MNGLDPALLAALLLAGVTFATAYAVGSRYRKAGPGQALVITGGQRGVRIVRGGGTFVWPVIEEVRELSLRAVGLAARTSAFHAQLGAPTTIEACAEVRVEATDPAISVAAEQFLAQSAAEGPLDSAGLIARFASRVLESHMKSVLGTREAQAIFDDVAGLQAALRAAVEPDLAKVGLSVVSLTLGSNKAFVPAAASALEDDLERLGVTGGERVR